MTNEELQFQINLSNVLVVHPEWLEGALSAISRGMWEALARANEQTGKYDLAFRAALSLADPGRISSETKALLNRAIVAAIEPNCASEIERKALKRAAEPLEKEVQR